MSNHYNDSFYLSFICNHGKLSEEFLREKSNEFAPVCWNYISRKQKLSEPFIREFSQYLNFYFISKHQKLSESFIEEFSSKFNWDWVFTYQNLSRDFLVKHLEKVEFNDWIDENQFISNEIKEEIKLLKTLTS